jgi:hypothetical protein
MNQEQRDQVKELLHMVSALLQSMDASLQALPDNLWKYAGYYGYIREYNHLLDAVLRVIPPATVTLDRYDLENTRNPEAAGSREYKELFDSVHAKVSILRAYLESQLGLKADEITSLKDFLQANLRRMVLRTPPKKERDVQDLVEQALILRGLSKGLDYDRETGRVKVSIKEAVPDFILPRLGLALEVKLSKDAAKSREIVDEINADIKAYGKGYANMLFVVYDLGTITDEDQFKRDLEAADNVAVIVVKH